MLKLGARSARADHAARLPRGLNVERVFESVLDRSEPFTRAELIRATGLSAPTVGSLARHLIRTGLLNDLGTGPSRGGRRPAVMEFNARHGFVAAIDLGPTHTRLAAADLRGEPVAKRVVDTPTRRAPATLLARLARELQALLAEAGVDARRLLTVAAGLPGVVDRKRGVVAASTPNPRGWRRVPVAAILRRELSVPVVVEGDTNLAVLGERWRGVARGHDNCVFLHVGTRIGAGVVIDGVLRRGHHMHAGEVALMCMGPQFVNQDFGSRGCLESLAGLKSLALRWPRGAHHDPETWLAELFRAARAGDRPARKAIEEASTLIGIAVANMSLVLDPSLVVLGGALSGQGDPFVSQLRRVVARIVPAPPEIVVSGLEKEAPLWGGLLVARDEARARLGRQLRGGRLLSQGGSRGRRQLA